MFRYPHRGHSAGFAGGRRFGPLIAVEAEDGFLILVEGHSRATAYVASRLDGNIDLLVGSSPAMPFWHWY